MKKKESIINDDFVNDDEAFDEMWYNEEDLNPQDDEENYIKQDLIKNSRGKFAMRFMLSYISYLQQLFNNDPKYAKYKRNITISYDNIMSILSPYADTEQNLIDYIQKIAA